MRRFLKWVREWARNDTASTAVEFSLVAVPFTYILIGIIEISLMFGASSVLNGATNDAARLIRTGQAQTSADPEVTFRDMLCSSASALIRCDRLRYEVIEIPSFESFANFPPSFNEDGDLESQGFDAGGVNTTVLIRTAYRYRFMTPFLGQVLSDASGNSRLMMSTVVLQTEPYEF
jgi:hypothetical protein